ncbi:unnamed protein product [Symbiodinium microadriaticum]|nr:unnamed protein product [Symbiodinium microadriaticum]
MLNAAGADVVEAKQAAVVVVAEAASAEAASAPGAAQSKQAADPTLGISVDINSGHGSGHLLKRGPVFGYKFQSRWCLLTNTQLILYKDENFTQRLSVERLTPAARAFKFSRHDAPGEAVKHKAEKPLGFVLDSDPSAGKTRKLSYFDAESEENLSFWLKAIEQVAERRLQAVTLHVYDILGPGQHAGDNGTVELRGTGAFHLGLEVAGLEWSYGYAESGTGVFQYSPLGCEAHSYRGVVELGYTQLDAEEALARVRSLQEAWKGTDYDPLRHSCCDFVTAACDALGAARLMARPSSPRPRPIKSQNASRARAPLPIRPRPQRRTFSENRRRLELRVTPVSSQLLADVNDDLPTIFHWFVDVAAWSIRARKVSKRLAALRHLELLVASAGAVAWLMGYWSSSSPRTGSLHSWTDLKDFLKDEGNILPVAGAACTLLYHLFALALGRAHRDQVRADGLHRAAARGDAEAVARLLRELAPVVEAHAIEPAASCRPGASGLLDGGPVNALSADGLTPLHLAASSGADRVVRARGPSAELRT